MMLANIYESNGRLLLERVPLKKLIAEKGQRKVGPGTPVTIHGTTRTVASVNSGTVLMVRLSPPHVAR